MNFTYPANVHFECNCCGLCCGNTNHKTRHILLLEKEAKEISAQTGLHIKDFTDTSKDTQPYIYEMKKVENHCFFLNTNKCDIYGIRPLICRFYPFELTFDADKNLHIFTCTPECPTLNTGKALSKKTFEELFELAKQRLL